MPDWFRLIWVLLPLAFILRRLGARALPLFLFPPLWFAIADGMVDLWLLFPLVWMLENRPGFAGLGVVLTLVKPSHLARRALRVDALDRRAGSKKLADVWRDADCVLFTGISA